MNTANRASPETRSPDFGSLDSGNACYVLHAFQKKSPRGIKTAQVDIDLVERRLKIAQQDHEARHGSKKN